MDSRCKTPIEEIQAAVDGAISHEQAVKLRQCLKHIDELEMHKAEIEREIFRLSQKYESVLDLIRTIPGFDKNPLTAIQVLSEIGADMSVFPTAKNLVAWSRCCPRNDQSSRKIKSTYDFPCWFLSNQFLVQMQEFSSNRRNILNFTTQYRRKKHAVVTRKSYHCHLSYDPDRYLAHTYRFKALYTGRFS